jgi:hypothetical protein
MDCLSQGGGFKKNKYNQGAGGNQELFFEAAMEEMGI